MKHEGKSNFNSKNKREENTMETVLSLERHKCIPITPKDIKKDISDFCRNNINDIIELETNRSGVDEFEKSMRERRKDE